MSVKKTQAQIERDRELGQSDPEHWDAQKEAELEELAGHRHRHKSRHRPIVPVQEKDH